MHSHCRVTPDVQHACQSTACLSLSALSEYYPNEHPLNFMYELGVQGSNILDVASNTVVPQGEQSAICIEAITTCIMWWLPRYVLHAQAVVYICWLLLTAVAMSSSGHSACTAATDVTVLTCLGHCPTTSCYKFTDSGWAIAPTSHMSDSTVAVYRKA